MGRDGAGDRMEDFKLAVAPEAIGAKGDAQ